MSNHQADWQVSAFIKGLNLSLWYCQKTIKRGQDNSWNEAHEVMPDKFKMNNNLVTASISISWSLSRPAKIIKR